MKSHLNLLLAILVCLVAGYFFAVSFFGGEDSDALTRIGQPAPEFKLTTLGGDQFDNASLKGKVVLLNFFATWCQPCMLEMPHLEADVWQRYKDRGLMVIAVGSDEPAEVLRQFQKQRGFTIPMAADPDHAVYGKFARRGIPRSYLIDAQGRIVFQFAGYAEGDLKEISTVVERELAAH